MSGRFAAEGTCELTFSVAQAAVHYGTYGHRIFPICPETKMPLVGKGGFHNATTNKRQIESWWKRWPNAIIGVACGGDSRLVILDIDVKNGKNGPSQLKVLELMYGKLPKGPILHTPSGGIQMLFTAPPGVRVINNADQFALGIDVRGCDADGTPRGYGTLPPSVRPSRQYEWADPLDDIIVYGMLEQAVPELPPWALFLAMFNNRRRERLAEHGIASFADFHDIPPQNWVAHADELLQPRLVNQAKKRSKSGERARNDRSPTIRVVPDVPLDDHATAHVLRYVTKSIIAELKPIRTTAPGSQDNTINDAALSIHSLLKGAKALGLDIGLIEDKCERIYFKSVVRMVAGNSSYPWSWDGAEHKWLRTKEDAEPRDLTHLLDSGRALDFEPLDEQTSSTEPQSHVAVFVEDAALDANIKWLFDEVLAEGCVAFLSGKSSTGKSAIMVRMVLALAKGKPFFGRDVPTVGGSYIVAAEHAYALPARVRAACDGSMVLPVAYNRDTSDLMVAANRAELIADILKTKEEMKRRYGVPLKIVFIDTFSRAFMVDDENSSAQITKAIVAMLEIANRTGTTVVAVHHYGKDSQQGMRGSSAFRGNTDFEIVVENKNGNRSLRLEKGRDAPEGPIGSFTLATAEVLLQLKSRS